MMATLAFNELKQSNLIFVTWIIRMNGLDPEKEKDIAQDNLHQRFNAKRNALPVRASYYFIVYIF